ncbi:hypothetical protein LguiB_013749 [Lonicera macranthoides]
MARLRALQVELHLEEFLEITWGLLLVHIVFSIRIGTTFLAKIPALIQGIEFAHQHGWRRIWIEFDSLVCCHDMG